MPGRDPDDTGEPADFAAIRPAVEERYRELLLLSGSPLLADERVIVQLTAQLNSILVAVLADLGCELPPAAESGPVNPVSLSAEIGESRAASGVHPSQSLHAAGLIFQAALPVIAEQLRRAGRDDADQQAALALNRIIMDRMAVAGEFYIGFLLERIHQSNSDERRRLSRELHDVVAPSIVLGLQNLQLHEAYQGRDPEQATDKLEQARSALQDAMASVRGLAAETRESLSRNGLRYALEHVLDRGPAGVDTDLNTRGDVDDLPAAYRDEIFLIVREGIRNAYTHSRARAVQVSLARDEFQVVAAVHDNGHGFTPVDAASGTGLGLTSMNERVALLGGVISIDSTPGRGTDVAVRIPLPPHARRPSSSERTAR